MSEKISFDVDWDNLFPGKPFVVADKSHNVTPLNIEGIAKISKKIRVILPILKSEGIDWNNLNDPEVIIKLVPILMDNTPDIVSEATGISIESLVKFPPAYLLEIVTIAIEVNLESKEALEKNFEGLVKTFQSLQAEAENLGQ
jgi:hypothetical protein